MSRASLVLISMLSAALLLAGCDGDGGTDAGAPAADAGPGGTDAGPGGTDAGPGETDAGPGGTDAGPGGASAEAMAFCTQYETTCGFGAPRFADRDACLAAFDGFDTARQMCVTTHLGLAGSGMTDLHCGHATGNAPCN